MFDVDWGDINQGITDMTLGLCTKLLMLFGDMLMFNSWLMNTEQ